MTDDQCLDCGEPFTRSVPRRGPPRCPACVRGRIEAADAVLHPTGRCTCAGEGHCEWCRWRADGEPALDEP